MIQGVDKQGVFCYNNLMRQPIPLPTQERLHELFYCVNGKLIRKVAISCFQEGDVVGTPFRTGHIQTTVDGTQYKVHRLVWKWYYGTDPGPNVDHWDRNPSNNNIWNLRDVTGAVNTQNNKRTMEQHNGQLQTITVDGKVVVTPYGRQCQLERTRRRRRSVS